MPVYQTCMSGSSLRIFKMSQYPPLPGGSLGDGPPGPSGPDLRTDLDFFVPGLYIESTSNKEALPDAHLRVQVHEMRSGI